MRRPRRTIVWWAGLVGLACSVAARAEDSSVQRLHAHGVDVTLRVGPTKTTTAGRIVADLTVAGSAETTIEITPPPSQGPGGLSVVSASRRGPTLLRPGTMSYGLNVVYTPFLGGAYEVPPFVITYRGGTVAGRLETAPVTLTITSVVAGDPATAIPDGILPDVAGGEGRASRHLAWIGVVALVSVGIGWWWLVRRRRAGGSVAAEAGPYAAALSAIEKLAVVDAAELERVVETLRAHTTAPVPDKLGPAYQWIRFGSPGAAELARFAEELKAHWRAEVRREAGREGA